MLPRTLLAKLMLMLQKHSEAPFECVCLIMDPGYSPEHRRRVEENARRLKRFSEVAKNNGTSIETVQKRHVLKIREKIPAGSWYQDDSGAWLQKK